MNAEELASRLNGREYGQEMTEEEEVEAFDHKLVVVFGYSDDNAELRGAISDELSCYGGGEFVVWSDGLLENKCDCGDCPYFAGIKRNAKVVNILWDQNGYSWIYTTTIPHAPFDILEDGEKYCRGIVFSLDNLG